MTFEFEEKIEMIGFIVALIHLVLFLFSGFVSTIAFIFTPLTPIGNSKNYENSQYILKLFYEE